MTIDGPLVLARRLTRTYRTGRGNVAGILEASFQVATGAGIALVGPSGSGKSTLLHLMANIDHPTGGEIEWPALGPATSLRPGPVAMAFQGQSLLPPLTILENVALPCLLAGWSEERAHSAAVAACERFEIESLGQKLPEEVSGGQSQRAGLARALACGPRLLLADEPTGQQDRRTGRRVVEALVEWADGSGAALVVATHDLDVAERFGVRWTLQDARLRTGVGSRSG